jgi:hypothetical protein
MTDLDSKSASGTSLSDITFKTAPPRFKISKKLIDVFANGGITIVHDSPVMDVFYTLNATDCGNAWTLLELEGRVSDEDLLHYFDGIPGLLMQYSAIGRALLGKTKPFVVEAGKTIYEKPLHTCSSNSGPHKWNLVILMDLMVKLRITSSGRKVPLQSFPNLGYIRC